MSRSESLVVAENSTLQRKFAEIEAWKKAELAKIEQMTKSYIEFQTSFDERKRKAIADVEEQAVKKAEAAKADLKATYDRVEAKLSKSKFTAGREATEVSQRAEKLRALAVATKEKAASESYRELAAATSFKPVKQDAEEVRRLAAYRAAQHAAKIEEEKRLAVVRAAQEAALKAEYERNTVAKKAILDKRDLERKASEQQHLENLNQVRQARKPTLFYASFMGKGADVWAVDKQKPTAKKPVTRKEKIEAAKEVQAHKDVQNDFDALQRKSVETKHAPERISMWKPKRFPTVADAVTQTADVGNHVDPVAPRFGR